MLYPTSFIAGTKNVVNWIKTNQQLLESYLKNGLLTEGALAYF